LGGPQTDDGTKKGNLFGKGQKKMQIDVRIIPNKGQVVGPT
jgi:hypothetical protein